MAFTGKRKMKSIRIGSRMQFADDIRWFTVRAISERFAVCNCPRKAGSVWYTIVDIEQRIRGPENLILGMGAETDEQCRQMLDRLEGRAGMEFVTEVSRRNCVPLVVKKILPPKESRPDRPHNSNGSLEKKVLRS